MSVTIVSSKFNWWDKIVNKLLGNQMTVMTKKEQVDLTRWLASISEEITLNKVKIKTKGRFVNTSE